MSGCGVGKLMLNAVMNGNEGNDVPVYQTFPTHIISIPTTCAYGDSENIK